MAAQLPEDPLSRESIDRDFQRLIYTDLIGHTLWRHGKSLGWSDEEITKVIAVAFFRRHEWMVEEEIRRLRESPFFLVSGRSFHTAGGT
jgi:hypothetical protein